MNNPSSFRPQNAPYGSNVLLSKKGYTPEQVIADKLMQVPQGGSENFRKARRALRTLKNNFDTNFPGRAEYQRTLGYGGFGLATLWKIQTSSGQIIDVAVKSSMNKHNSDENELRSEIAIQGVILRGAEHVVQLIDVEDNIPNRPKLYNNPEAKVPVMIMEVLEKSNLHDLLDRINKARITNGRILRAARNPLAQYDRSEMKLGYIPNRILWRFFLCLTRGIIGMAYGPPIGPGFKFGDKWRETIADFGIAFELHPLLTSVQKANSIIKGKHRFYAPEQRDYDFAANDDQAVGIPLNVWAIGVVMMNLLTLAHPQHRKWEARVRSYPAPTERDPNYRQRFVTWGWFLLDDEEHHPSPFITSFDPELRLLIARCLETYGPRRPTLEELLVVIERNITVLDTRHRELAEARVAREEEAYRQRLITREQREVQARNAPGGFGPASQDVPLQESFRLPRGYDSNDPLSVRPWELAKWLDRLEVGNQQLTTTQANESTEPFDAPINVFNTPGEKALRPGELISLPHTEDPWEAVEDVPMPPGYDPDDPVYLHWPPEPPTPGFQGVPPVARPFEPIQPRPPNSATRFISRNEYRPITEFQTPPELEDVDLLTKFYDDHFRNPPAKVDPYAHMWQEESTPPAPEPVRRFRPRPYDRGQDRTRSPHGRPNPYRVRTTPPRHRRPSQEQRRANRDAPRRFAPLS
ncbi:hypothetical protein K445DRAFT_10143 [Daldinia sp. EC12]|nr:hypothetical protein K445DRAFT_10143 [Daldinia sp. EC12]